MTASNRNTARSTNTGAQAVAAKQNRALIALFTRSSAKTQAALFIIKTDNPEAPIYRGHIGGVRVGAFLRRPADTAKSGFLSFVSPDNVQVATGNVIVRDDGIPVLKAVMADKSEVWINVSKNVNDAMLHALGANMAKLHIKTPKAVKTENQAVPA